MQAESGIPRIHPRGAVKQGGSIVIAPLYDSASIFPHTHLFENQSSPLLLPMNIGHSRKFSDVTVDDWQQVGRKLLINETLTISLVRETVERTPDAISDAVTEFRTFAKEHELEYDQALLTRLSDGVAHQTKSSRITKSAPVPMALQAASPDEAPPAPESEEKPPLPPPGGGRVVEF